MVLGCGTVDLCRLVVKGRGCECLQWVSLAVCVHNQVAQDVVAAPCWTGMVRLTAWCAPLNSVNWCSPTLGKWCVYRMGSVGSVCGSLVGKPVSVWQVWNECCFGLLWMLASLPDDKRRICFERNWLCYIWTTLVRGEGKRDDGFFFKTLFSQTFFFFFFFPLVMHIIGDCVSLATSLSSFCLFVPGQCSTALFIPYFVHGMYIRYYYMVICTRLFSL